MNELAEVKPTPIVKPSDAQEVVDAIKAFEYFKAHALSPGDFVEIQGKPYVKKSGWSKYALGCNVSTELKEERIEERNGVRIYHFTYKAIHLPSGRFAEAVGSASEEEKTSWNHPEHDIRSLAQTRAYNRAISNLVGGGELSAEELSLGRSRKPVESTTRTRNNPRNTPSILSIMDELRREIPDVDYLVEGVKTLAGIEIHNRTSERLDGKSWATINDVVKSHGGKWTKLDTEQIWVIPIGG